MTTTPAMPELPEHAFMHRVHNLNSVYDIKCYMGSQMNARYTQGYNDALATLQAQTQPAAVSDAEIRTIGHRTAWRFKRSSDPAHSDTYTFNDACLLAFASAIHALRPQADPIGLDVEAMIKAVLPGGYSCDPQQVADAIRAYMALRPQAVPMTEAWLYDAMRLADAYADACFDQGLNQRTEDPNPEAKREKLVEHLRHHGIADQAKEGGA